MSTRPLSDLMNLKERVALITGGGGHVGAAAAEALAELGANLALLDTDERASQAVARRVAQEYGVKTMALVVDLSAADQTQGAPAVVLERFDRLDILINCAAFVGTTQLPGWAAPFRAQRLEAWRGALGVNLTAPFLLSQACTEALEASGHGVIVNVASIYGVVGPDMRLYRDTLMGNPAAYAASKGGLLQLTRWLATVLAPRVRVNAITPGGIWRGQPDIFHDRYIARTPLQRMASEDDLKGAFAYLASDMSAYVTGHNLVVDGGWTAW